MFVIFLSQQMKIALNKENRCFQDYAQTRMWYYVFWENPGKIYSSNKFYPSVVSSLRLIADINWFYSDNE